MRNYELSDTYKILYDHIIHELLSIVCRADMGVCVRDREIPYIIGELFEKNKRLALNNMSGTRLDRHKLASCICGAIVEAKPLMSFKNRRIRHNVNEIIALYAGLNVLKFYMIYSSIHNLDLSLKLQKYIVEYLKDNFKIIFPTSNENICDTQDYQTNLLNSLFWTHHRCDKTNIECFYFDIWAYSKIFYHLEVYNKDYFNQCLQRCTLINQ